MPSQRKNYSENIGIDIQLNLDSKEKTRIDTVKTRKFISSKQEVTKISAAGTDQPKTLKVISTLKKITKIPGGVLSTLTQIIFVSIFFLRKWV